MSKINVIDPSGASKEVEFEAGSNLMEVLRDAGFEQIQALCGGCCSCATCHVHISADQTNLLPQIEEDEQLLLEFTDDYNAQQSRLSCQLELESEHDGLTVTLFNS